MIHSLPFMFMLALYIKLTEGSELQKAWNVTRSWNVHSKFYTTYFTKIPKKWASKVKNYCMTKKHFMNWKFYTASKNFTRSWIAWIVAFCNSASLIEYQGAYYTYFSRLALPIIQLFNPLLRDCMRLKHQMRKLNWKMMILM